MRTLALSALALALASAATGQDSFTQKPVVAPTVDRGETPLGGAVPPTDVVTAPVAALPRRQVVAVTEGNALDPLFDEAGYSRVAGTAALLPTGPTTPEVVRELAAAGVRAVLVDGPIPAGSLGVNEPLEVPIVGIPSETASEVRASIAAGRPVELAVGAAAFEANPALRAVATAPKNGMKKTPRSLYPNAHMAAR